MSPTAAHRIRQLALVTAIALTSQVRLAAQSDSSSRVIVDTYTPHCNITNVRNDSLPFCQTISPLIVLDGEPVREDESGLARANALDPADIIGVDHLSGHDGVALYGVRGIGGLLLITTKHPPASGCHPAPDTSATATPPEFIQIDGPPVCGKYDKYVLVVNGVLLDSAQMTVCDAKLDPASIATVRTLKPAAAAAVYGSRASTGAIVVTLKNGIRSPCDP